MYNLVEVSLSKLRVCSGIRTQCTQPCYYNYMYVCERENSMNF